MSPVLLLGIRGYRLVEERCKSKYELYVELERERRCCVHCGSDRVLSKGRYERRVRHLSVMGKESKLIVSCRRYRCNSCNRTCVPQLPGIKQWRHSSEPFRRELYEHHHNGIAGSTLAKDRHIGSATVNRIYSDYTELEAKKRLSDQLPEVLGIDEHTLHKGFQTLTTLCDLKNHRVFDIVEGRSAKAIKGYLMSLKGRKQVKMVCIDLSSSYRRLIRECFPNARIVSDRFHVVRVVQHHFMELFKQICPQIERDRGMLAALRKKPENLTEHQRERLDQLLRKYPALKAIYEQQLKVLKLMRVKGANHRNVRRLSKRFIELLRELKQSAFQSMLSLANTLERWAEPIACMWRFNKNNGITEGFHRKMKLIQRRAYGFRNFNNYRLRVIASCG